MTEFHQVLSAFSFSPLIDTPIFCSRGPILQVSPSLGGILDRGGRRDVEETREEWCRRSAGEGQGSTAVFRGRNCRKFSIESSLAQSR